MSVIHSVFCARQNEGNPRTSKETPPETLTSEKIVLPVYQQGLGVEYTEMVASLVYGMLHLTVLILISRAFRFSFHVSLISADALSHNR
jgi:hypothetical protein